MPWDKILSPLLSPESSISICRSEQYINISWKDAVLGNVVNMDNDLETTYLELEKVTNMDSNQNEIKVGEYKPVQLGRNWTRFIVLLRNVVSDNVRRYRTSG